MNGTLSIILGVVIIIGFFILELDLIHISKNLAMHKELFPLDKQKYVSLTTEEQDYLSRLIDRRYEYKGIIYKKLDFFGLLDETNEDRLALSDEDIQYNLYVVNKIQKSIGCKMIGLSFTVGTKAIIGIAVIFIVPVVISFFI